METFAQRLDRYRRIADLRGVAKYNPVVLTEVYNNMIFKIVVGFEEPSNNSIPFNVLFLCVNPAYDGVTKEPRTQKAYPNWYCSPGGTKLYRRVAFSDNLPNAYNRNTWELVDTEAKAFSDVQIYDLNNVFMIGELTVGTPLPTATIATSGVVRLNGDFISETYTNQGIAIIAGVTTSPDGGEVDCNISYESNVASRHYRTYKVDVVAGTWYTLAFVVKPANASTTRIGLVFMDNFLNSGTDDHIWSGNPVWPADWPANMSKNDVGGGDYFEFYKDGNGNDAVRFVYADNLGLPAGQGGSRTATPLAEGWFLLTASRYAKKTSSTVQARVGICTWNYDAATTPNNKSYFTGVANAHRFFVWESTFVEGKNYVTPIRSSHNVVVADNDPRMTDARPPVETHLTNPNAHPIMPVAEFVAAEGNATSVGESAPPVQGNLLFIGSNGKANWRAATQTDLLPDSYTLVSVAITTTNITDTSATAGRIYEDAANARFSMTATYKYTAGKSINQTFVQAASPVTWSILSGKTSDGLTTYNAAQIAGRIQIDNQGRITIDATLLSKDSEFVVKGLFNTTIPGQPAQSMSATYTLTVNNVVKLQSIVVTGSTLVVERAAPVQYKCMATLDNGAAATDVAADPHCSWELLNKPAGANITLSTTGLLTVLSVQGDCVIGVKASYYYGSGTPQTYTLNVTAQDIPVTLTGLTISGNGGNTTLYENTSVQYTATATYSDSTTANVTNSPGINWTMTTAGSGASIGTNTGLLTIGEVQSDTTDRINCTYTEGSTTTPPATININIRDNYVTGISVTSASNNVNENSQLSFTATFTRRNGSTYDGTSLATWSCDKGSMSGNVFNAPTVSGTANTTAVITASYTNPTGPNPPSGSKTVNVINVPLVLYPKYGVSSQAITDGTVMNNLLTTSLSKLTSPTDAMHFTPGTGLVYCYFALPDTLGSNCIFQQCDAAGNNVGLGTGGWDGATMSLDPNDPTNDGKSGALTVSLITAGEAHNWKLYRTTDPGLGDIYYKVTFS